MPDESVHSTGKVALGFFLGLILSAVCFVIAVVVGMNLGSRLNWVFPLLNAIALLLASLLALRKYNESGVARGTVAIVAGVVVARVGGSDEPGSDAGAPDERGRTRTR